MSCPTMPTVIVRFVGQQLRARFAERAERARHQRVAGGIELRAANGRGEAANEVVGHTQLAGGFHYLVPPAGGDRRGNNMASAAARRTPRDPVVLASSRTASADGAPVARSARAAAARMRAVRIGAHQSPR